MKTSVLTRKERRWRDQSVRRTVLDVAVLEERQERRRETWKNWRKRNAAKCAKYFADRRARELLATPKWVDHMAIEEVYLKTQEATKNTGVWHHVDHIIPLKGNRVCGLHVPWNLRPLPATENLQKHNSFAERDGLAPTVANGLLNTTPL